MPRGRKKAETSAAAVLQRGLAFCAVAYKDIGDSYQTHVTMADAWIRGFDGVLAAGYPIEECPQAAPHGAKLALAIGRPGQLSLALADDVLAVTAGAFRARIPCLPIGAVAPCLPDAPRIGLGDGFKIALGAVAHLAANSGATVLESSLLISSNVISATNRLVVMQIWHGLGLPQDFVVPRQFATAVIKAGEPLKAMGWCDTSLTVHFESGAWLRTQLYAEKWPELDRVFPAEPAPVPLPDDFFFACEAVAPFSGDDSRLTIELNMVRSMGADYTCNGLPQLDPVPTLSAKLLALIAGRVTSVDWTSGDRAVFFFGENIRAAVMRCQAT